MDFFLIKRRKLNLALVWKEEEEGGGGGVQRRILQNSNISNFLWLRPGTKSETKDWHIDELKSKKWKKNKQKKKKR